MKAKKLLSIIVLMAFASSFSVFGQTPDTLSWTSGIDWNNKSKRQLERLVSKTMNTKLKEFSTKWTQGFVNTNRQLSVDDIMANLLTIATEYQKLYASASAAYIMNKKGYFTGKDIDPFPFEPKKEVDKEYQLIGNYLSDIKAGFKDYISYGNRGIENYLNEEFYEIPGGRKIAGGKAITREYAKRIVQRWERLY